MTKSKRRLLPLFVAMICALGIALFAACGDAVEAESVTLNETALTVEVDGVETLTATVAPENATDKTVTWTSSDSKVASVDKEGNVTGVSEGTATITATTANGKTATCEVTVGASLSANEVTAEQWAQILGNVTNYTVQIFMSSSSSAAFGTYRIDGDKCSMTTSLFVAIIAKEGDHYYQYTTENGSTWTKIEIEESVYMEGTGDADFANYFTPDYSAFTYADGKYTAASLEKDSMPGYEFRNVEITFENGALTGLACDCYVEMAETTFRYQFSDFGTTTVQLPTEYTEV